MIKSIFVFEKLTKGKIDIAVSLGANSIFTGYQNISQQSLLYAKRSGLSINLEVGIFVGEHLWKKYPHCRPIDINGSTFDKMNWYTGVCPNNQNVIKEKLALISKIVNNYQIDGLWLDFIRYPCYWETIRNPDINEYCFCKTCISKFKREVGAKPQGRQWYQWKCQQITSFARQVKMIIKNSQKKILLGMFVVPWQNHEFNGAIRKIIGQDFKMLSDTIDIFSPMIYHKICKRPIDWIDTTVKYFYNITQKPILSIIQTEDRPDILDINEFSSSLIKALSIPSSGVIIFYLEDLIKNQSKQNVVKNLFKSLN